MLLDTWTVGPALNLQLAATWDPTTKNDCEVLPEWQASGDAAWEQVSAVE